MEFTVKLGPKREARIRVEMWSRTRDWVLSVLLTISGSSYDDYNRKVPLSLTVKLQSTMTKEEMFQWHNYAFGKKIIAVHKGKRKFKRKVYATIEWVTESRRRDTETVHSYCVPSSIVGTSAPEKLVGTWHNLRPVSNG